MKVTPLSAALGADVSGIDLSAPLDDARLGELRGLFDEAGLICFRGQGLTPEAQVRAVGWFGPLAANDDGGLFTHVSNVPTERPGGDFVSECRLLMHSDLQFAPAPLLGLSLYALECAPGAAPTLFANARRAYERLPASLKARIAPLMALQVADYRPGGRLDYRPRLAEVSGRPHAEFPRAVHPLVYPHPRTGEPILFASEHQTTHVIGLPEDESEALIGELLAALYAPDNSYRHEWSPGDLLIWDNVALQHGRPETPASARRVLRRVVLSDRTQSYLTQAAMTA